MGNTQSGISAVKMLKKIYTERVEEEHKKLISEIDIAEGKELRTEVEKVFAKGDILVAEKFPWLKQVPKCNPHTLGYNHEFIELKYNIKEMPTKEMEHFQKARKKQFEKKDKNHQKLNDWEICALKAVCSHEGLPEFEPEL